MKNKLTLFLVLFWALANAQPEITQSNLPLVGDHVVIGICSDAVNPGNPGAMQTWDMSYLTETEEQFFTYIDPAEGLRSDSFPAANLCAVSWLNDYSYYNTGTSSLSVEGHVVTLEPSDTSVFVYNNNEQILGLPYTFNDGFTDTFDGSIYLSNLGTFSFDGTLDFEADGYGTLILPNGTYQNVVRYHFYREQTNYFGGFPAGTQTKEQWAWVSADYRFWLLLMEENWDGFSTTSLIWYDKNPYPATTSIGLNEAGNIAVYPNPCQTSERLNIRWDKNERATLLWQKIDGSLVTKQQTTLSIGANIMDGPKIDAGLYILSIESDSHRLVQRISVLNK
jgi:hypothetical protein